MAPDIITLHALSKDRNTTQTDLTIDALAHAHGVRGNLDGAVFHSGHGSVYTSQAFQDHCTQLGVRHKVSQVLFRLSRWENLDHAQKI